MTAPPRNRTRKADPACVAAADLARSALVETAGPDVIGEHLGHEVEGERLVTHYFDCVAPAYAGWRWAVTVTRASRSRQVTVNESVLLPGPQALIAPEWVPWSERLRPGDLGAGDLLPTPGDDPRLVPGYTGADEDPESESIREAVYELGLGRPRVLSPEGRAQAIERWYAGEGGPESEVARSAPAECATCGFFVRLSGQLGMVFGVCANEMSPSDGRVVSYDHGCGAHSEVRADDEVAAPIPEPVFDTVTHEPMTAEPVDD